MMSVPLRCSNIPWMDPNILEEYSNLSLVSYDGQSVKVNPLVFVSMCTLDILNPEDEEHVVITELSIQDLHEVKQFCHYGNQEKIDDQILKTLGICKDRPLLPLATEKVEVKMETEVEPMEPLEHLDFSDTAMDDNDLNDPDYDDEDYDSKVDMLPLKSTRKKPVRKSTSQGAVSKRNANGGYDPINSRRELTEEELEEFDRFEPPKPMEEYRVPPQKLHRPGNITKHFENSVECKECGQNLSGKRNLKKHMIKYHQDHFDCTYCDLAWSLDDADSFRLHLFKHLYVLNNVNACVQCGKQWKTPHLLRKHQAQKGPFHNEECTQCSSPMKTFQVSSI